jgi:hypothetical protein
MSSDESEEQRIVANLLVIFMVEVEFESAAAVQRTPQSIFSALHIVLRMRAICLE